MALVYGVDYRYSTHDDPLWLCDGMGCTRPAIIETQVMNKLGSMHIDYWCPEHLDEMIHRWVKRNPFTLT